MSECFAPAHSWHGVNGVALGNVTACYSMLLQGVTAAFTILDGNQGSIAERQQHSCTLRWTLQRHCNISKHLTQFLERSAVSGNSSSIKIGLKERVQSYSSSFSIQYHIIVHTEAANMQFFPVCKSILMAPISMHTFCIIIIVHTFRHHWHSIPGDPIVSQGSIGVECC